MGLVSLSMGRVMARAASLAVGIVPRRYDFSTSASWGWQPSSLALSGAILSANQASAMVVWRCRGFEPE